MWVTVGSLTSDRCFSLAAFDSTDHVFLKLRLIYVLSLLCWCEASDTENRPDTRPAALWSMESFSNVWSRAESCAVCHAPIKHCCPTGSLWRNDGIKQRHAHTTQSIMCPFQLMSLILFWCVSTAVKCLWTGSISHATIVKRVLVQASSPMFNFTFSRFDIYPRNPCDVFLLQEGREENKTWSNPQEVWWVMSVLLLGLLQIKHKTLVVNHG